MRSLRARLLAASLAVALPAVLITAWAVNRTTSSGVRDAVRVDLEGEEAIYEELSFFAFATGSWDGVDEVVADLSARYDERVALTTADGEPIADSDPEEPLPASAARFIDPDNPVIQFDEAPAFEGLDEFSDDFAGLMDALDDAGVPFDVQGGFGMEFPVWDPDDPAAWPVVEQFFFDEYLDEGQILVGGVILPDEEIATLLSEAGIPFEEMVGPDGEAIIVWDDTDPLLLDVITGAETFPADFLPFIGEPAEPALLFLGSGTGQGALPDPIGWPMLAIVAAVAGLAVVATVITSRRVLGPVGALTAAAGRLEEGHLSERVPVGGTDEIARLAGAFNAMAGSLEDQDRLRKTMTSDIAHELRTPLSNIRGYLEAVEEGLVDPTPEIIGSLRDEAVQLQRLIDDLQDLTLAEAGELALEVEETDLADLLQRAATAHRASAEAAGVTLDVTVEPVRSAVDAARIRQVIANLVGNAVRHTPSGGSVRIGLAAGDGEAVVTVADTGEGIAPEHLPHVFDRLYRADPSRSRETGGAGMGLAIAAELVRLHGGTISAESEPGNGSRFTVRLPAGDST